MNGINTKTSFDNLANVNFIVDNCAQNVNTSVVGSKTTKGIVPGDSAPVHKPMKTWKQ